MVKLRFSPNNDQIVSFAESKISSKLAPKQLNDLNPFKTHEDSTNGIFPISEVLPIKQLVGLENCHYTVKSWYEKSTDISNKFLLMVGPIGCGKTSLIESFCENENILLYSIKPNELVKTKKELIKEITNFIDYYEGSGFFTKKNTNLKKLILIDEYQNGQSDLLSITDIINLQLIRTKKADKKIALEYLINDIPPILIIAADSKGTKLSDLKKAVDVYYIGEIPRYIIKNWVQSEYLNLISSGQDIVDLIINKCKSDKRLIINTLQFIKIGKLFSFKYSNSVLIEEEEKEENNKKKDKPKIKCSFVTLV